MIQAEMEYAGIGLGEEERQAAAMWGEGLPVALWQALDEALAPHLAQAGIGESIGQMHCCPNLRLQGIGAGAHEGLDLQMLLEHLEEQFDLPAVPVLSLVTKKTPDLVHWKTSSKS